MKVVVLALAGLLIAAGCSQVPGFSGTSPSASGSPPVQLDDAVPTPAAFPADVPVYPRARLTAAAAFNSAGEVTYGMEWQTTDDPAKVQAYYQRQLNQGDWKLTVGNAPSGALFAGTFARNSNSHDTGTITVKTEQGVTVIALSFFGS
ncbi:MAG TPA: hypothetical protein VGX27_06155 [Candidatus Dormibacteraeota bacterium]|nr:hypothetical protein [Candidatus Dormibacteraeota bacterium]